MLVVSYLVLNKTKLFFFCGFSPTRRLEGHELIEFRRIAASVYKKNNQWRKAVELAKADRLFKVWEAPQGCVLVLLVFCRGGCAQLPMQRHACV